jgi:tRNA(fMet)-specific endonuclease VapC
MLRFLLDTDHVTLYERGQAPLVQCLNASQVVEVGVSAVTVAESLQGRLANVSRARDGPTRIFRYAQLVETVQMLQLFPLIAFDQGSDDQYQRLLAMRLRVGPQDLKIAAVALTNNLTLLTRNRRDFGRVPGLALDDWTV